MKNINNKMVNIHCKKLKRIMKEDGPTFENLLLHNMRIKYLMTVDTLSDIYKSVSL